MITKIQVWHTYGKGSYKELFEEFTDVSTNFLENIVGEYLHCCADINVEGLLRGEVFHFDNYGDDWDDQIAGFVCVVEVPETYNEHIFALSKEITEKCHKIDAEFRMKQGQAMMNVFSNTLF